MAEVIVALDAPPEQSRRILDRLPDVRWVKVGPILYTREGPALIRDLVRRGVRVFLDLKWHDIPNTVGGAVEAAAELGVAMATSLFLHGKVVTTEAKAKELRPYAEKLITLARRGDLHARRLVSTKIRERDALSRLFTEIGPRFAARPGGYTRILKLGHRPGDGADVARIELLPE